MADFVIFPLRSVAGCSLQGGYQRASVNLLDVRASWQRPCSKPWAIEVGEGLSIRNEPCFHHLHHQVTVLIVHPRYTPVIPVLQVLPWRCMHRAFCIDKQDIVSLRMCCKRHLKSAKGFGTRTAGNNLPLDTLAASNIHNLL